jgi:hypothetical protein
MPLNAALLYFALAKQSAIFDPCYYGREKSIAVVGVAEYSVKTLFQYLFSSFHQPEFNPTLGNINLPD